MIYLNKNYSKLKTSVAKKRIKELVNKKQNLFKQFEEWNKKFYNTFKNATINPSSCKNYTSKYFFTTKSLANQMKKIEEKVAQKAAKYNITLTKNQQKILDKKITRVYEDENFVHPTNNITL